MPKFRSSFSDRVQFHCSSGEKEFPIFCLNEEGEVIDSGKKENVFAKIQTFEDDVLLSNIIKRCGLTGETLLPSSENYGDTTVLPTSLLDLKQSQGKVQDFVDSLSKSDLDLLNDKGFDEFISSKISALIAEKNSDVKKDGDSNE